MIIAMVLDFLSLRSVNNDDDEGEKEKLYCTLYNLSCLIIKRMLFFISNLQTGGQAQHKQSHKDSHVTVIYTIRLYTTS